MSNHNCAEAFVLAGGKSRRLSIDKTLLKVGKEMVIENLIGKLKKHFKNVYIITNTPEKFHELTVKCYKDIIPDKGPLGGIYTGLELMHGEYGFFIAADMPFLNDKLIKYLLKKTDSKFEAIVPSANNRPQPLYSLYSKRCLKKIKDHLISNKLSVTNFLNSINTCYLNEDFSRFGQNLFFDIDTKKDYRKWKKLQSQRKS